MLHIDSVILCYVILIMLHIDSVILCYVILIMLHIDSVILCYVILIMLHIDSVILCYVILIMLYIDSVSQGSVPNAIMKLQNCVESIHEWCRSRRLQLNPAKTKANLKKTVHLDLNLYIGADVIKPVGVVRDLGIFSDAELNMDQHVKTVVRSCFFHLRRLKSVRRILGREVILGLVSAFVTTRLDYCNSVLTGLPQALIDPLQKQLKTHLYNKSYRH